MKTLSKICVEGITVDCKIDGLQNLQIELIQLEKFPVIGEDYDYDNPVIIYGVRLDQGKSINESESFKEALNFYQEQWKYYKRLGYKLSQELYPD